MTARELRPLAFLLLMVGFGLRLDSSWQWTASATLVAGAALAIAGWGGARASVSEMDER
jgi:hypothetical protein